MVSIRHYGSRRAYCAGRETQLRQYDTARKRRASGVYTIVRRNIVRTVHVVETDGVHTTLSRGVVRAVHVAKSDGVYTTLRLRVLRPKFGWRPYDNIALDFRGALCGGREIAWRPHDTTLCGCA